MRLGSWVRIKQSDKYSAVIAQFEGRIGEIIEIMSNKYGYYPAYRVCFGDCNDLFTNEANLEEVPYYWGEQRYYQEFAPNYVW